MRVLVLDGNENQAVACVRSLATAGHDVVVGAATSWSKAAWSRFAAGSVIYKPPQLDAGAFIRSLVELLHGHEGTLVLPMTERTTLPISEHRAQLIEAGARLVLPSHENVLRAFDKAYTTELASALGCAVPQTIRLTDDAEARALAETASYPVVLKPQMSEEVRRDGRVVSTGRPVYARSAAEFMRQFSLIRGRCSSVLAQQFMEGYGAGYFALVQDGRIRAEFAHRRIRDVRPTGSGSALRVSAAMDPRIQQAGRAILESLEWHGVAMVEFRVPTKGPPVFLEVNGRFWNSLALAVHSGADFPRWLAEMAEHGTLTSKPGYQTDVRCRWFLGDTRHLLEVLRGPPPGFPGRFPNRLAAIRDFLTPVRGTCHDNFMMSDPLPELGDWMHFVLRRVLRIGGEGTTA